MWSIPRLDYEQVKSVRGFVGVSASPGLRLVPAAVKDVNEIAVVFFPKKIQGLQAAYRIKETGWEASLGVERMELALQVDALHLYSIGQGIVYGSSVLNYLIGGKPVSELKVLVPADYDNVEFVGRDVRNWKLDEAADNSVTKSYTVYFQSTLFGDYTLLVNLRAAVQPGGRDAGVQRRASGGRAVGGRLLDPDWQGAVREIAGRDGGGSDCTRGRQKSPEE